jgi:SSS family solute:Na+ symporter
MLAANIGAGSTVGATSSGYVNGVEAWWWVGSAAVGSTILAFAIGPRMRAIAAAHNLQTVGDFLEFRFDRTVRAAIAVLLWLGSTFILASQLLGLGWILEVVAHIPRALGCAAGGLLIVVYFASGGLLTAAWVNVVQLTVKLVGFAVAVPLAINSIGGIDRVLSVNAGDTSFWTFWRVDAGGMLNLVLLAPAFVVSPGLLQKVYGARDDRAVRLGVGLNALGLFAYAGVPALLGIIARGQYPDLAAPDLALPTVFVSSLPPVAGALGLAAVFSAELSAADASLFMLTTSLSQDLYKRFVRPDASEQQVLWMARVATILSGSLAIGIALLSESVLRTLTVFYTLLGVSLFVPIVAGLYSPRTSSRVALVSIAAGVVAMLTAYVATGGAGWGMMTPALVGLSSAIAAWAVGLLRF